MRTTMATRKSRMATFQAGITLYREEAGGPAVGLPAPPLKQPPVVARIEAMIKDALIKEGYPDHRVSAMRTDI